MGAATRETGRTLASVFKNPNPRRVQLAFVGSSVGDGAYATALTVWAARTTTRSHWRGR